MPQSVSVAQLQTQLAQGTIAPLYALIGEEDLLRDQALTSLKAAVLGDRGGDFNCDLFYGDEAEGGAIVASASDVAVFAERRLVIVKAADRLPARHGEQLLPYLKQPNDSTTVVFVAPKLDGRLKFTQALAQASVIVDCQPLMDSQCVPWLKQDAARLGIELSEDALHLLKEACGASLYSVRRELEKLASYVPANRSVTAEDVLTMRGTEPGASVFDLAAAIGAGNHGRALAIVARNVEAGEAPLKILGSLAWQYRRIWKVKELMRQGGRDGEAARTLRMDPYHARTFVGRFSETHLRYAFRVFLESDAKLKGGSSGRPAMVLDRLIFQLCEGRREDSSPMPAGRTAATPMPRSKQVSNVRTIRRGSQPRN